MSTKNTSYSGERSISGYKMYMLSYGAYYHNLGGTNTSAGASWRVNAYTSARKDTKVDSIMIDSVSVYFTSYIYIEYWLPGYPNDGWDVNFSISGFK